MFRPSLLRSVRAFAERHELWRPDTRVVAAVSGGSDSIALVLLLSELHANGDLRLDAVAHLNHGIRGPAADDDEAFCRDLAARLGAAFVADREDVPALARRRKQSIEVAGREARHRFFEAVRRARSADVVATAHTADDQAETVLLRLVRGSGLRGLGGIAPRRGALVRPLLDCSREALRDALRACAQPWREDETNAALTTPRNRVRHELLPYLEEHFNPRARQALARLADLARDDNDWLDREAAATAFALVRQSGEETVLPADRLVQLPSAVARRVVHEVIRAAGGSEAGQLEVDQVREVARGAAAAVEVSGLRVEHSGASVVLVRRGTSGRVPVPFEFDLPIPGVVHWAAGGWALEAEGPITRKPGPWPPTSSDQVEIASDGLGRALVVRSRRPGDRIRPRGLGGRKKVQDVLVDRKVRRADRALVPIVTDQAGRLIWVAGHVLAEEFGVTTGTNTVVILKLRRI